MSEFDDWPGKPWVSPLRAVGLTKEGQLIPIKEADNARGLLLSGLIVSVHHRVWFKENEDVLRATFAANQDRQGQIIIFGSTDSVAEVFS